MLKLNLALIALILVLQVVLVNRFSGLGGEVAALKEKSASLKTETAILKKDLFLAQSLDKLSKSATNLGLAPQSVSFVRSDQAVASSHVNP